MANRLAAEASPYLRAHRDQPIDWYPWGPEPFERARNEARPLLVSTGYLACHWCHVMAEESFADPAIGAILDRDFVCIKVDREERPDVDRAVLDGLARLGGRTGWPATAFMTPAAEVYAGGSYYPPTPLHGLAAFRDVLDDALRRFRAGATSQGPESSRRQSPAHAAGPANSAVADSALYAEYLARRLLETVDPIYGGFGLNGPKFPQPMLHELLWRSYAAGGETGSRDAVVASVESISRSALFDHVGGGFHRYCVDEAWQEPHFEKMLYDNAQMLELLCWLWRGTGNALLAVRAEATVAWLTREMLVPGSGFASSLGAFAADDTAATAGGFYAWQPAELADVLGGDADAFWRRYELGRSGLLAERVRPAADRGADGVLDACLGRLRQARRARPAPLRDDKVLADWNGLLLAALVEAGLAFGHPDWIELARTVFDTLVRQLADGERLHHGVVAGHAGPAALLEDYAAMSRAALRLFEVTGEPSYRTRAEGWVSVLDARFWDQADGGYFATADDVWRPGARLKTITETTMPTGNGVMIAVLGRLHELTGEGRHRERAEQLVAAFRADIVRHGPAAATALNGILTLHRFVRIVVDGDPADVDTRTLLRTARACCVPDRMVLSQVSGVPAFAQLCVGPLCLLPTRDADALRRLMEPGGMQDGAAVLVPS